MGLCKVIKNRREKTKIEKAASRMDTVLEQLEDIERKKLSSILNLANRQAYTRSGKDFVKSCRRFFKQNGFLTEKQIYALLRVDERKCYYGDGDRFCEDFL